MYAVLWDLDGTLIDSAEYHWQAWFETMRAEGVRLTRDQFQRSFGQRNDTILTMWLGAAATTTVIARVGEAKEAAYRRLMREGGLEPLPGAERWTTRLRGPRWKQAIASSAPQANVETVLDILGWHHRFETVVSAEDVRVGKPDPEVFVVAAARLDVPPSHCVVVEDAAAGVEAARRAGMRAVGVGAAASAGADLGVQALTELPSDAFEMLLGSPRPRT